MTGPRTIRLRLGRRLEDGPGVTAVTWSFLIHAAVLGALVFWSSRSPKPADWMSATVRIASALPDPKRSAQELPAVVPPTPTPERPPEPAVEPVPQPQALQAEQEPLAIGPRRKPPEAREKPPEPTPAKPRPKPKAKPADATPDSPATDEPGRTLTTDTAAVRFEGQEVPHDAYLGSVVRRVSGQWLKPRSGLPGGPARVYFEIGRNGRVGGVTLELSSGVATFDRSAMRAVHLAEPLPPLPPAYRHENLKVHFDFIP